MSEKETTTSTPQSHLHHHLRRFYWGASWLLFLFPFVLYAFYVVKYTLNLPIWDDFDMILHFINSFIQNPSLGYRGSILFLQHNEHRVVFEKIIFILQYYLFGQVNFGDLNYFGNLGWFLSIGLLAYAWKDKNQPFAVDLLPYAYLLLSFLCIENMFWASASLSFCWSIFFIILFIYCLVRASFLGACVAFGISIFTYGSGLALLPLAWVYLFFKRRYQHLAVFAPYSLLLLGLFFYHYTWFRSPGTLLSWQDFPVYIKYWLTFLGAPIEILTQIPGLAWVCGLIGCLLGMALWLGSRQKDEFTWLLLGFVLLVATETALLRSRMGIGQALSTRYVQYTLLFWCGLIFISVRTFSKSVRFWFPFLTLLTVFLFFRFAFLAQEQAIFEKMFITRSNSLCAFQSGYSYGLLYPDEVRARRILFLSRRLGVYDYKEVECLPLDRELGYLGNILPFGLQVGQPDPHQPPAEEEKDFIACVSKT